MGTLLYIGQLAAFCGCVALGFTVKNADVHCSMQLVTTPLPAAAASPGLQDVPCDADDAGASTVES